MSAVPPPPLEKLFRPPAATGSLGGLGFRDGLRPAAIGSPVEEVEGEDERGAGGGGNGGRGGVMDRSVTDMVT